MKKNLSGLTAERIIGARCDKCQKPIQYKTEAIIKLEKDSYSIYHVTCALELL